MCCRRGLLQGQGCIGEMLHVKTIVLETAAGLALATEPRHQI